MAKGIEYEADQRHAEIIAEELGVQDMKEYRVPYEKPGDATKEGEEELGATATTRYRAVAARANYLALDRPDIQFTVKELCRGMSKPKKRDWVALERLGRYLHGRPRLVQTFEWQAPDQNINAYSDADWASCKAPENPQVEGH